MAATDITNSVANFREAARHLWNCHYLPTLQSQNAWDVRDSFDRVVVDLFRSLVLEEFGIDGPSLAPASADGELTTVSGLIVRPRTVHSVPILINRERPRSSYWDHPKKSLGADEAELRLARFFDFDQLDRRDFRYLEVLIARADGDHDLSGRWALLGFEYAKVYLDQSIIVSAAASEAFPKIIPDQR